MNGLPPVTSSVFLDHVVFDALKSIKLQEEVQCPNWYLTPWLSPGHHCDPPELGIGQGSRRPASVQRTFTMFFVEVGCMDWPPSRLSKIFEEDEQPKFISPLSKPELIFGLFDVESSFSGWLRRKRRPCPWGRSREIKLTVPNSSARIWNQADRTELLGQDLEH